MEIQIINKDQQRRLRVMTFRYDKEDRRLATVVRDTMEIAPGTSATFYLHLLQDLQLQEVEPDR
jgi:hypothetical protein